MTRPARSVLVVDGETVRLRLQAERLERSNVVHVDWLRFTVLLRDAPLDLDVLFPVPRDGSFKDINDARVRRQLETIRIEEKYNESAQALSLAREVVEVLGPGFAVGREPLKGHDFYARRWPIEFDDCEVGWVGYGASSDSEKQRAQARTLHCNLYGMACTFARTGWRELMADRLDEWEATVTRCDLALDFFDGFPGGLEAVVDDYKFGVWNVNGREPSCDQVGDWVHGKGRSFYIGSKAAGKQTNVYEKGHQLFGKESGNPWLRFELRYGNKLRELPSDLLRSPDSFFSGASDAHASVLAKIQAASPVSVPVGKSLPAQTVEAEVTRNLRWLDRVAAPSLALAFQHLGQDAFLALVTERGLPGRLQKFSKRLSGAYESVSKTFFGRGLCPNPI